jgi:hypothetical protein
MRLRAAQSVDRLFGSGWPGPNPLRSAVIHVTSALSAWLSEPLGLAFGARHWTGCGLRT